MLKEEFEKSLKVINPLLREIEKTDREIDSMVHELYGLTDEEIQIVEESWNNKKFLKFKFRVDVILF